MMHQNDYILQQVSLHKNFQMRDAIKLSYQASFGAEHLLNDVSAAKKYLHEEWVNTPARQEPIFEQIAQDVFRINIGAWKKNNLPEDWLLRFFVQSAQNHAAKIDQKDGKAAFLARLDGIGELAKQGALPFSSEDWEAYQSQYLADGIRAVHHSDIYRESNLPAYRVVSGAMCRILPIFERIKMDAPFVIAIDGRAASGKSTLAENLCAVLEVDAIHMDDFFLPMELRTEARLAESGGNIHYERFAEEVLPHLKNSAPFSYQRFDCSQMALGNFVPIGENTIRVVEGSYCHHEIFGDYADLRVILDVDPEEQMRRIQIRDGAYAEMFRTHWIPMEEQYFSAMHIRKKADLVL